MILEWTLFAGLVGAILMFTGDMLLYFCRDDYVSDGTLKPVIDIMKTVGKTRLSIGSLLGPVAAFFYCIGYFHIVLIMERYQTLGWVGFLINCLGIILGGAYHSHWIYFGRIGRLENEEALKEVISFTTFLNKISYAIMGTGFAMVIVFVAFGFTVFPRWMTLFTPGILFLLTPLLKKLPRGFLHMVLLGGWSNLISIIYYVMAIMVSFGIIP